MLCKKDGCKCCGQVDGLAHIGVFVKDLQKSVDFYADTLGFECFSKADIPEEAGVTQIAFIRCGTCVIEIVQPGGGYSARADGPIDHIALNTGDLESVMLCLAAKGIAFDTKEAVELPQIFDHGVRYIFFRGPDGERIEISQTL